MTAEVALPNCDQVASQNAESSFEIKPTRCNTMPPVATNLIPGFTRSPTSLGSLQRLKNARDCAEKAMKNRKIFSILGPYPIVRESLRRRGWIEKFQQLDGGDSLAKKSIKLKQRKSIAIGNDCDEGNGDEDDDDAGYDDDGGTDANEYEDKIPPWEEDGGYYGILSRIVRNCTPTFFFTLRRDMVDVKSLKKDQMLNHFGKAGSFTTKVGLCTTLRSLPWYNDADPNTFYPRCYRLSHDEEKQDFIDDYRLTACMCILKWVCEGTSNREKENAPQTSETSGADATCAVTNRPKTASSTKSIPSKVVDFALARCRFFLQSCNHDDIDKQESSEPVDAQWDEFLKWFYQVVHEGATITKEENYVQEAGDMLKELAPHWPQLEMDGRYNMWIVKPGALSRGRGVICYHKLDDMLSLVSSSIKKDSKYVVQKYIEKPLLVHNTKFDIRQWFLVTDWNPLTIWFYKRCYLRFSSQEFTLKSLDEAIHLCNNSIQKNYSTGKRNPLVPEELMWTSEEFQAYLEKHGKSEKWYQLVYPSMKQAIIYSLMCSLDIIEPRKSEFELYGADFMLTEDLYPWLIEINSSPCMAPSTKITAEMCADVLEDVVKVVVDRKSDRNCDIGDFELACRLNPVTVPQYLGINLSVEGQSIKRPFNVSQSVDGVTSRQNKGSTNYKLSQDNDSSTDTDRSDVVPLVSLKLTNKHSSDNDSKVPSVGKSFKKPVTYKFLGNSYSSEIDKNPYLPNSLVTDKKYGKKKLKETSRQVSKANEYLMVDAKMLQNNVEIINENRERNSTSVSDSTSATMTITNNVPSGNESQENERRLLTAPLADQSSDYRAERVTTAPTRELESIARLPINNSAFPLGHSKLPSKPVPQAYHQTYQTYRRRRGVSGKLILRYTDAGIQKPQVAISLNNAGVDGFPQIVSRYIKKQSHAGNGHKSRRISVNSNPAAKLSIVTHAFFT